MGRVEGKVAIVTGGAAGIGEASCLMLAKEGAKIAVTDINDEDGRKVVSAIEGNSGIAQYWHIDVSNEREVSQAFSDIHKKFGKIDILVNNAGIPGLSVPSDELEERDWDRVINIDLKGVFLCTKHAAPYIKKAGGGSIINLSSGFGLVGGEDPAYHAAKGGVRLLTKSDAYYYAKYGIRVNSVHPGAILTPLLQSVIDNAPMEAEEMKKILGSTNLLGYLAEPKEVAFGILYLASDESKFVTGSELVIDAGFSSQ